MTETVGHLESPPEILPMPEPCLLSCMTRCPWTRILFSQGQQAESSHRTSCTPAATPPHDTCDLRSLGETRDLHPASAAVTDSGCSAQLASREVDGSAACQRPQALQFTHLAANRMSPSASGAKLSSQANFPVPLVTFCKMQSKYREQ